MHFPSLVDGHVSFNIVWVHITLLSSYSIHNDRHSSVYTWLDEDNSSPGMYIVAFGYVGDVHGGEWGHAVRVKMVNGCTGEVI